jgi:hypothetical protein
LPKPSGPPTAAATTASTTNGSRVNGLGNSPLADITFIRSAQQLGLSLDEICEVLAFRERREQPYR